MGKKLALLFIALGITVTMNAQFEEGKVYANTSLSGLNLSYNGTDDLNIGLQTQAGYMFRDNLMFLANISYLHVEDSPDKISLGVSGRYYIVQNGLYLGAGIKYMHCSDYNDIMPGVELGYAFFLSRSVTIEPALYYDQSIKNHSDYSTIGLKVGFGFYL
jgi:hypothetical protein